MAAATALPLRLASRRQIARKKEDRIAQAQLDAGESLSLDWFIRRDPAAAVDRSAGIGATGGSYGFALKVRHLSPQRAAAIDVVVIVPVGVITLNQASRRREVLCRSER